MNPYTYCPHFELCDMPFELKAKEHIRSNDDVYLENSIIQQFGQKAFVKLFSLLEKLQVITGSRGCGQWFNLLSLGYDVIEEIGVDEASDSIYENFVKITPQGKRFIKVLFTHYIKPNL
jgi:hypothetical protein